MPYISVSELQRLTGIPRTHINKMAKGGLIPAQPIGPRTYLFDAEEVEAVLRARAVGAEEAKANWAEVDRKRAETAARMRDAAKARKGKSATEPEVADGQDGMSEMDRPTEVSAGQLAGALEG
jgi:excisionase family DNA binding protein